MNTSPTLLILLTLIVLGAAVAGVAAQKPDDYSNGSSCDSRAVKELVAVTQSGTSEEQEVHLNNAEAFERLGAMGFREC